MYDIRIRRERVLLMIGVSGEIEIGGQGEGGGMREKTGETREEREKYKQTTESQIN